MRSVETLSNVEKVLNGDISVELSATEFKEVNLKLVKAIATSNGDEQKGNLRTLLNLGIAVNLEDHERIWYAIRALQITLTLEGVKKIVMSMSEWLAWARYFRDLVTSRDLKTVDVPFYNVPCINIPFDWENA